MKIDLTKIQIENLIEFFELEFIDSIRNDDDVDNMDYLCDMCDVYRKLQEAQKDETATANKYTEDDFVNCNECLEYAPDTIQEGRGFCGDKCEWVSANEGCTCGRKVRE